MAEAADDELAEGSGEDEPVDETEMAVDELSLGEVLQAKVEREIAQAKREVVTPRTWKPSSVSRGTCLHGKVGRGWRRCGHPVTVSFMAFHHHHHHHPGFASSVV